MKKLVLLLLICLGCTKIDLQPSSQEAPRSRPNTEQTSNNILIKFKNKEVNTNVISQIGGKVHKKIQTKAMSRFGDDGFFIVEVPNVSNAIKALQNNPNIEWVVEDYQIKSTNWVNPNDPYFTQGQLWGMQNIKAPQVWASGNKGNQNIIVGVIDAGIYFDHPDLCGQIWNNPFDPVDGVDNDNNGYIDDVNGWNFVSNNRSLTEPNDDHGTHVSGTIAGKGNNGIGVVGVAPQATIIGVKFLDGFYGGTLSGAVLAVDYLTDLKIRHNLNIIASNNSWGGGGYAQPLFDAIERHKNAGILFINSAGNATADLDVTPVYPSSYGNENIISVAATTSNDGLATFSNYGARSVHLGAPGHQVISTVSPGPWWTYSSYSGTSMAAPHVTGAAILYKNANPGADWRQIKNAILNSVRPIPALMGKTVTGGTLDVSTFTGVVSPLQPDRSCSIADTEPPAKVGGISLGIGTDTTQRIDWVKPYDNYGVFVYNVSHREFGTSQWTTVMIGTPAWVFGVWPEKLKPGTKYEFMITALDYNRNESVPSDIWSFTTSGTTAPPPPPPAPTVSSTLTRTGSVNRTYNFSWVIDVTGNASLSEIRLEVSFNGGAYTTLHNASINRIGTFSYTPTQRGNYAYRLFTKLNTGQSSHSNIVTVTKKR